MYNYVNVLYHTLDTYNRIYLNIFAYVQAASFQKNTFL